jgi:hypothetical protein
MNVSFSFKRWMGGFADALSKKSVQIVILIAVFVFVVTVGSLLDRGPPPSPPSTQQKYEAISLEQKLAAINAGHFGVPEDDITVRRFRFLLASIHSATGVDREKIADKVVWAQGRLHDRYGKNVTVLEVMEALNDMAGPLSSYRGSKNLDEMLAIIIVLTGTEGRSGQPRRP